jgi:hypothetical protein
MQLLLRCVRTESSKEPVCPTQRACQKQREERIMRTCLTRTLMLVLISLMLSATAIADDGSEGWGHRPSLRGPIFDITHFDVIPLAPPQVGVDFE